MKKNSLIFFLFLTYQFAFAQISTFEIKVYLEGPYFNEQMTPFLNVLGEMPTIQPYNIDPWNYNGGENVVSIPNFNIVDWILVDILTLEENDNELVYTIKSRKACFLLKNGDVTNLDGNSLLSMNIYGASDFYLRIIHRNHLSLISSETITTIGGIYSYDFTTGPDKVMGANHSIKQLNTDLWGMISADGDANGQIDNEDKDEVWFSEKDLTGYYHGDFNMDTQVDEDDKITKWIINCGKAAFIINDTIAPPPIWNCGETFTDIRDGQQYNTVQIGSQCWMAENLNIGIKINGSNDMTNNGVIEKYCFDNLESNCDVDGGFYQWDEMMDYVPISGTQGLCPPNGGWHIPTDAEWFTLENFLDPSINDPSQKYWRGTDCGTQLKQGGSSGFNALMTGWRYHDGSFEYFSTKTIFWTSTENNIRSWFRILDIDNPKSNRNETYKSHGNSVRCLKD